MISILLILLGLLIVYSVFVTLTLQRALKLLRKKMDEETPRVYDPESGTAQPVHNAQQLLQAIDKITQETENQDFDHILKEEVFSHPTSGIFIGVGKPNPKRRKTE